MLDFLKNHPFAVEAFFEKSIVLTFAIPKVELRTFIPNCLTLDTLNDKFGFIAIALVQTKNLRPVGLPDFMGNDFFLVGYRVFVRYTNTAGKNLRGLYILKSETDKTLMEHLGNLFTHYNYTTTDIKQTQQANQLNICSKKSDFTVNLDLILGEIPLPKNSPFKDWK